MGGDRKKYKGDLIHTFHAMKLMWQASDQFLVVIKSCLDCALAKPAAIFTLKKHTKFFLCYHLQCSLNILIIVFGFLYTTISLLPHGPKLGKTLLYLAGAVNTTL